MREEPCRLVAGVPVTVEELDLGLLDLCGVRDEESEPSGFDVVKRRENCLDCSHRGRPAGRVADPLTDYHRLATMLTAVQLNAIRSTTASAIRSATASRALSSHSGCRNRSRVVSTARPSAPSAAAHSRRVLQTDTAGRSVRPPKPPLTLSPPHAGRVRDQRHRPASTPQHQRAARRKRLQARGQKVRSRGPPQTGTLNRRRTWRTELAAEPGLGPTTDMQVDGPGLPSPVGLSAVAVLSLRKHGVWW